MQQVVVIVLTGGGSTRMGRHKPALDVGGRPIIARVLAAVAGLPVVVVGDGAQVPAGVPVVCEDPPGGGPVAGIAAGLAAVDRGEAGEPGSGTTGFENVVLLAGDLPFLTRTGVHALLGALAKDRVAGVALAVDPLGQTNWLCAAWRTEVLRDRLAELGEPSGTSMRRLNAGTQSVLVPDAVGWSTDVDTPADLAAARARATPAPQP